MILVTERNDLAAAMGRIGAIVDSKQVIPILGNVLLTAAGDQLSICSTNGDMQAVEYISAHVGVEGITTINAAKLAALANSLPPGAQVAMKMDETKVAVTSGRSRITLGSLDPRSFPKLWDEDWPIAFDIDAAALSHMLERVAYAQASDVSRAYLKGVRVETIKGRLRFVAIQGAHLAHCDGPEIEPVIDGLTIPSRMVTEMAKLVAGAQGTVSLAMSPTKVMIRMEGITITSKLIDGSMGYPDYHRLFPADLTKVATVNIPTLSAAIRRALIASQNAKDNTVRVTFKPGAAAVTARNAEADAFDEIDVEYDGEETMFALDPTFLVSILEHLGGDLAEFTFKDNSVAMTIRAPGEESAVSLIVGQRVGP